MQHGLLERPSRSVADELRRLFRVITALALVLLLSNAGARIYLLNQLRPRVQTLELVSSTADNLHAHLLDEETGLRGYLATGSPIFLAPYTAAEPTVAADWRSLDAHASGAALTADLAAMRAAQSRWTQDWVRLAADPRQSAIIGAVRGAQANLGLLTVFMAGGKILFDRYRTAHARVTADLQRALARADAQESRWLVQSGIAEALTALFVVAVIFAASRRLRRQVARPVASLARAVTAIRMGNLSARVAMHAAPTELLDLSRDIDEMAAELQAKSELVEQRAREAQLHADRLELVLQAARDVSGSLSLPHVLNTVAATACRIGASQTRIWLVEAGTIAVTLGFDSEACPASELARDLRRLPSASNAIMVDRAVRERRACGPDATLCWGEVVIAVPMTVGGRVVGVLECVLARSRKDIPILLGILEVLAGQAAGSIKAIREHEGTLELSVTDPLTQLSNRRAFDADLDAEVRRAIRYGHRLSVIYLDLDNFKELNDRFGHACGDVALQRTAAAIRTGLRQSDRCYRVGGEELVVIAPETGAEEAMSAAERLREAVEHCTDPEGPKVTASFGVAELPAHAMDCAALVQAADDAVYAAKAAGRNCVTVAAGRLARS